MDFTLIKAVMIALNKPIWGKYENEKSLISFQNECNHISPLMARGGGGEWMPPPTGFSNFSQKWEEIFLQTKVLPVSSSLRHRDNTIKDNVKVTSSNFSQNDGTIRILTHFLAKIHRKLTVNNKNLIQLFSCLYNFTHNLCFLSHYIA